MPGFDPREPETYWGLFRREARLTAERRGHVVAVGEPARTADGLGLDWSVRFDGQETRYTLLRWDDIVRARFPRPNWQRLREVPALWWRLWRSGYTRALRREARRFSTVIRGVHQIYAALVVLSLVLATAAILPLPEGARPWSFLAVPVLAYGILGLLMRATRGRPLYVAHLVDDTAFTHDHARGAEPRMLGRLDAFAERIRAAEGAAAEIVLIGHSSSSFLGAEVLARILAQDPAFGRRGTPVSFVTIGSVIPWIGLDPRAVAARAALTRVAEAQAIGWLDIRAPWDWLSIHLRDPLVASGLRSPGPDRPAVMRVTMRELIEPERRARLRWNLFQMHFQLLMASRAEASFDYVSFVAGPVPVHRRVAACRVQPGAVPAG
ncbi:hydrolase [Methylobacterium sp. A54F]